MSVCCTFLCLYFPCLRSEAILQAHLQQCREADSVQAPTLLQGQIYTPAVNAPCPLPQGATSTAHLVVRELANSLALARVLKYASLNYRVRRPIVDPAPAPAAPASAKAASTAAPPVTTSAPAKATAAAAALHYCGSGPDARLEQAELDRVLILLFATAEGVLLGLRAQGTIQLSAGLLRWGPRPSSHKN